MHLLKLQEAIDTLAQSEDLVGDNRHSPKIRVVNRLR